MDLARQAPLSMGFSRQEYWSGFPFPSPGDFPNPGIETKSPALQVDSLPVSHQGSMQCGSQRISIFCQGHRTMTFFMIFKGGHLSKNNHFSASTLL